MGPMSGVLYGVGSSWGVFSMYATSAYGSPEAVLGLLASVGLLWIGVFVESLGK